jgi:EAL domain-containing protein (putative c-di-GMP-specific phosphodiesterase class I)/GGDEF domain-containing protein
MVNIVKSYLFRATLSGGFVIVLGIILSSIIYFSGKLVKSNSLDLVENRLPVLTSISRVIADMSEQERIVYEYYANQNQSLFNASIKAIQQQLFEHEKELAKHPDFASNYNDIKIRQTKLLRLIKQFDQTMQLPTDNWDELRALLVEISAQRRLMLPVLSKIERQTKLAVKQGHQAVLSQMNFNHHVVVIYAITLVILSLLIAWYLKKYTQTIKQNNRLALFPTLNPNAIISTDNLGNIIFNNPACVHLLYEIGLEQKDITTLIPLNFSSLQEKIHKSEKHSIVIEKKINNHVLQLTINWLKALDVYDIHILNITDQKLAEQKINHLAYYRQGTQLPNEFKLNLDIDHLIAADEEFSLGLFEVRHFNRLVTLHSVEIISELINVLSAIVATNLPDKTRLYHISQNQFALLSLDIITETGLKKLVEDIGINAEKPLLTEHGDFFVGLDFGFVLSPLHGNNFIALYKNVHTALNIAATDDYTNVIIFNEGFAKALTRSEKMLNNLHHALERNELFLVFQPQLNLHKQCVSGIETLVRWRHQNKVISPAKFIPLAEQSGLIVPIGKWILEQACYFAKHLVNEGYKDIVVAVNVSPRQFSHPDFINVVKQALTVSKLAPQNLELEITEGVFMHNENKMLTVLKQLKNLGIQLSIDDFGTGYSSLSYLKKFPVDKLKIDQSFVRDCHENIEDKALIKTIIALGKSLGMSLIAEGVESTEHITFLQSVNCDEIQGYWFSKPLLADDIIDFLVNHAKFTAK